MKARQAMTQAYHNREDAMGECGKRALLVYMTASSLEEAERLAAMLLERRCAAGVNIVPGARSLYWWQGEIRRAQECVIWAQTTEERYSFLESCVREVHSYQVPCILAVPVAKGAAHFLQWIEESTEATL